MTRLVFVRHSATSGGPGDPGLTFEGRALARRAGDELLARNVTHVYSSPLRRARQTAQEIALVLGLEIRVDERLRERTNWGDVRGETLEEFLERWARANVDASRARMASFVNDVAMQHPGATVVVVTHGGIVGDYLGGHKSWPHCGVTELQATAT
jgi:2,3-bisphosphoglycerate-dependent phosphoglycerate mutase